MIFDRQFVEIMFELNMSLELDQVLTRIRAHGEYRNLFGRLSALRYSEGVGASTGLL